MIYNLLTMSLYNPFLLSVFLIGPGVWPGANPMLGIAIAVLFACINTSVYALLGSSMPRSGGEYVFFTRLLNGGFGSALELGFWFFLNPFFFVYWAAWFFDSGVYYMTSMLGYTLNNEALLSFGIWTGTSEGLLAVGTVYIVILTIFLLSGPTRNYFRLQWFLIAFTLLGFLTSVGLFAVSTPVAFEQGFNAFMLKFQSDANLYQTILNTAKTEGYQVKDFSFANSFALAPLAYMMFCWGYWSSWNLGEVKGADRIRTNIYSMIGATVFSGILVIALGIAMTSTCTYEFLGSAGYLTATGNEMLKVLPLPLYYPILSAMLTFIPFIVFLIGFAAVAQGIQQYFNCQFGFTRLVVSASVDNVLPEVMGRVSPRRIQPVGAILLLAVGSIFTMILATYTGVVAYTANAFYASMVGFVFVGLAAVIFPWRRPKIYDASPVAKWKIGGLPLISVVGFLGILVNVVMLYYYLTDPTYGLGIYTASILVIVGSFVGAYIYFLIRRGYLKTRGIELNLAFAEVPPA